MALIFTLLVLAGFLFHFLSTWPRPAYSSRIAWGCWLAAAVLWALGRQGLALS